MDPPASPSGFIYDASQQHPPIRQSSTSTAASEVASADSLQVRVQREVTDETMQTHSPPTSEQLVRVRAPGSRRFDASSVPFRNLRERPVDVEARIQPFHRRQIPSARFSSIHNICLEATQKYLRDRQTNRQMRSTAPTDHHASVLCRRRRPSYHGVSFRYTPYAASNVHARRESSTGFGLTAGSDISPTESLLTNISRICDELWAQAQRDRFHVPGTERAAVENMAHLLEWAETIVWNLPTEDEYEDDGLVEFHAREVTAGKNLCLWLGDTERWEMIVALELEVPLGNAH